MNSTSSPSFFAMICHRAANCPVSYISTLSPGESVLTSAASQAPVPEDGKITTGPEVWKMERQPSRNVLAELRELRPAMVEGGAVDSAQNAVGYVGGAGDLQEMTAWPMFHELPP